MNSSPSSAKTIRFPSRRTSMTRLPFTLESGGSTLRSKKGLRRCTSTSSAPTTRRVSASTYTVMSGSSGTIRRGCLTRCGTARTLAKEQADAHGRAAQGRR